MEYEALIAGLTLAKDLGIQRIRQVAGDPNRAARWIDWTLSGQWRKVERSMADLVRRGRLLAEVARETRSFPELNASAIWAFRSLLDRGAPAELCTPACGKSFQTQGWRRRFCRDACRVRSWRMRRKNRFRRLGGEP